MSAVLNTVPAKVVEHCQICSVRLGNEPDDDLEHGLCCSCKDRPEAARLGAGLASARLRRGRPALVTSTVRDGGAREFTPAERSLIGKVHALMPMQLLLDLLNERLLCDLGPDAAPYTEAQLRREMEACAPVPVEPGGAADWASLRKLLAAARKAGTLALITEQVIDDFAVVFSLNAKQVMTLKDILLQGE